MNKEKKRKYIFAQLNSLPNAFQYVEVTNYIKSLEQENKELQNKIDKAVDVIHTQMKNNPSYKENLKIIENNLIKGSCKVCDLKDSDVDE